MSGKNVNSEDKKNLKKQFLQKQSIKVDDIDVNKILVSKKEPYGSKNSFKYSNGYNDDDVIRPLCIKLPEMIVYVRNVDGNRTIYFRINDSKLLKKYNQI